jgi:hypothetical protein
MATDTWDLTPIGRFILDRLDEENAAATAATPDGETCAAWPPPALRRYEIADVPFDDWQRARVPFIKYWSPLRVMAELNVIRTLVIAHEGEHYCPTPDHDQPYFNYLQGWEEEREHPQICPVHRLVAALWSDHPDYHAKEWEPVYDLD